MWGVVPMGTAMPDRRADLCGLGAEDVRYKIITTAFSARKMKWRNGFTVGATFEGEFSNVTRSYAGKGVVRDVW